MKGSDVSRKQDKPTTAETDVPPGGGRSKDSNLRWGELKAAASYGFKIQATHF